MDPHTLRGFSRQSIAADFDLGACPSPDLRTWPAADVCDQAQNKTRALNFSDAGSLRGEWSSEHCADRASAGDFTSANNENFKLGQQNKNRHKTTKTKPRRRTALNPWSILTAQAAGSDAHTARERYVATTTNARAENDLVRPPSSRQAPALKEFCIPAHFQRVPGVASSIILVLCPKSYVPSFTLPRHFHQP